MQEGQPGFPLPAEAWLDELLASIFRMLINLESTDTNGKDHVTFLMNDSSLYRSAVRLFSGGGHTLLQNLMLVLHCSLPYSGHRLLGTDFGCHLPPTFSLDSQVLALPKSAL